MLRLLFALSAAAAFILAARLMAALNISVLPRGMRLTLDCGERPVEIDYPGSQATHLIVRVLQTCTRNVEISTYERPGPSAAGGWTSINRWHGGATTAPEQGTIWLVTVPMNGKLKLECCGEENAEHPERKCIFEVIPLPDGGRHQVAIFEPARSSGCDSTSETLIFNASRATRMIRIEWLTLCTDRNNRATAPTVTVTSTEQPPTVPDEATKGRLRRPAATPGATPTAEWQKSVEHGRSLRIECPPGARPTGCTYQVFVSIGYTNEIFDR